MEYSITEQMACVIAREFEDDDILAVGLNAEMMLAAGFIAQSLYCPRLTINVGNRRVEDDIELTPPAWCNIKNTKSPYVVSKYTSHDEILTVGNGSSTDFCNVFFVGGIQIDKYGNTNLIGIKSNDAYRSKSIFKMRGPGSVGTTSIASLSKKYYVFTTEHSKRRLVDTVDFVSVPGYNTRRHVGLFGGPKLIITPLCVFSFNNGKVQLESYHPHTSIEEIQSKTGFHFKLNGAKKTKRPTKRELRILRKVDKKRSLKKMDQILVY